LIKNVNGMQARSEPLAIVGVGGRFAAAPDVSTFWCNLRQGRDCFTRGPGPTSVQGLQAGQHLATWGLMPDRDDFDAEVVGFPGRPDDVDPQHGILFEALWSAAEDAGVRLSKVGERTALYAGCARVGQVERAAFEEVVNRDATFAAGHFSYFHDLQRESLMLDASCATGLAAVHLAGQSLRLHQCDYALAGAVAIVGPGRTYEWTPKGIYSSEGVCRPFDRRANGTVPGDGAAAVMLRRLTDAQRDGDPIYAVIRSTCVDNDGRSKAGFTVPGVPGKIAVVRRALDWAGLDGSGLDYVEAHGVGIPLNDQIEATALTEALGSSGRPLALGSVKASIGHTDTAAGLAALIKTTLALHHAWLPATPNTADPIEEVTRGGARFGLLPEGRPWPVADGPRRAGVMSAGIGGSNAFAVLEAAPGAG